MEEKQQPWGQDQLQKQLLMHPQDQMSHAEILAQYYDLFLDDFDKLMKDGKNKKAKSLAERQEKEHVNTLNNSFSQNKAGLYEAYRESQNRKEIELNERYGANHFRRFSADPEKLIQEHQKRIEKLQEELKKREKG